MAQPQSSIDPEEVARFSALADRWWDATGPFAPLHRFNPVRLGFIINQAARRFGRDVKAARGFEVTGVDASERNIGAASAHAQAQGLSIDYRASTAEALLEEDRRFDVVLNMEVIEHVADPRAFLLDTARLMKPGGMMIVATLNRTLKALALAKIGAEYVLRWIPAGTHDWNKFLTPEELKGFVEGEPFAIEGPFGVEYSPLKGEWRESGDASINYMMIVTPA